MQTIIIVEDQPDIANNIKRKLDKYHVYIFNTIKSYEHKHADLYIVDIMLEKKSFSLIKQIRGRTSSPIVILTWYDDEKTIKKIEESWWDIHFDKLVNPNILIHRLEGILRICNRCKND